jgi:hypothetical protein
MTQETQQKSRDFNSLKPRVVKSLYDTLYRDCLPPPHKLIIPPYAVVEDRDNPGTAFAKVIYVVYCPNEKTHTVNITYKYDRHGKFLLDTMQYV